MRLRKILPVVVFALISIYIATFAMLIAVQRRFVYKPGGAIETPAQAGLADGKVLQLTTVDGETLRAWYVAPAPGKPLLLFFHGQGGNLSSPAAIFRALTADGNGLLAVEYRGYPGSTGTPTESGLLRDADAAYARALALGIPARHIVAFGESLGSGVAVALAAHHEVGALILESPYTSTVDIAAHRFWMFPVRLVMLDQFHSDERITQVAAPVLIIHGTADTVIPYSFGKKLFELAKEPKTFITVPDGEHAPITAVMPQVLQWIEQAIPQT